MTNLNIQKYLQNLQKLNLYSKKTDNMQILFKGICAKETEKFLRKSFAVCFLLNKVFQRAIKSQNPMTESKYRFSRVKVK